MDELLKEEVLELTQSLQDEEDWSDLRRILIKKKFKLEEIALVSLRQKFKTSTAIRLRLSNYTWILYHNYIGEFIGKKV